MSGYDASGDRAEYQARNRTYRALSVEGDAGEGSPRSLAADAKVIDDGTAAVNTLWAAVFMQAIEDLKYPDKVEKRERARVKSEVRRWFLAKRNTGPGSFLWLCNLFGFAPDRIRTALALTDIRRVRP